MVVNKVEVEAGATALHFAAGEPFDAEFSYREKDAGDHIPASFCMISDK